MDLSTLFFLGFAQAAFLVALLGSKRRRSLSDIVLAAWLVVLGLHHLLYGLHDQGVALPVSVLNLNAGVPLLQGPLLFLYVGTLTSGRRRLRMVEGLHLLPFLLFSVYVSFLVPRLSPTSSTTVSVFHLNHLMTVALLVSAPAYAVIALRRLRRHETDTLDRYSERHGRDLAWLRRIVLALLALWGLVIATALARSWLPSGTRHLMMGAAAFFVYVIGYFGWQQFAVVDPTEIDPPETARGGPREASPKYERSGLKASEIEELAARLAAHLDRDRPYLEPGITLKQIADHLETTPNRLSQAINQGTGKSFHQLINERRVVDFEARVLDPRNRHRTLLAVAFDSGFSSKSSFNRVFKELAGMSPRQYLHRQVPPRTESGSQTS